MKSCIIKECCNFYNAVEVQKTNCERPISLPDSLIIGICLLHVHYYSEADKVQKLFCIRQKFVLKGVCLTVL